MRGVGDEAALAIEGLIETIEKTIESGGEPAELAGGILDGKALVKIAGGDATGLNAHSQNGSETLASEKIPSRGGEKKSEGNQPSERHG